MDMASWGRNGNSVMRDQYVSIVTLHIERM